MEYTKSAIDAIVSRLGEVFLVLDSGEEYELHGKRSYEYTKIAGTDCLTVEGMRGDEYIIAEIPLDSIEHHYTHKEV